MPLTPAEVHNVAFKKPPIGKRGYDEEEVDAFLDEVEAELDRLIQENEELRAKLAECLRGKVPAMAAPTIEPKQELAQVHELRQQQEPMREQQEREREPVGLGLSHEPQIAPRPTTEDNMDTAARVLALAQQTADQAIADARREADETLGRARREAEEILGKARRQADQIVSEARSRAEQLDRDAQERHRQVMGSLVQQREELERKVDDLRAFEREYRSRLKAYLEGQLRELDVSQDAGTFGGNNPAVTGPQQAVLAHADARNGQQAPVATGPTPFPPPGEPAQQHSGTGAFHAVDAPPHERR
jgi:DivIVA domain-containing protein